MSEDDAFGALWWYDEIDREDEEAEVSEELRRLKKKVRILSKCVAVMFRAIDKLAKELAYNYKNPDYPTVKIWLELRKILREAEPKEIKAEKKRIAEQLLEKYRRDSKEEHFSPSLR